MQIITEFFKSILPVKTELETGTAVSILGTVFVYMTGTFDKLIEALLVLVVVDYISGIIAAYENPNKSLDSRRGLKGIGKKIMILLLVATAHFVDYVTGQEIVRTAREQAETGAPQDASWAEASASAADTLNELAENLRKSIQLFRTK